MPIQIFNFATIIRLLINRERVGNPNMFGTALTSLFGLNPNFGTNQLDIFFQKDCDEGCLGKI